MKLKITLIIFLFFSLMFSFSQRRLDAHVNLMGKEISFTRFDYSKYGLGHNFLIVANEENFHPLSMKVDKYLRQTKNPYHTFYFFVWIPKEIKSKNQKETILVEFVRSLPKAENLFILTEEDILGQYKKRIVLGDKLQNAKRINTDVNEKNILSYLTIDY